MIDIIGKSFGYWKVLSKQKCGYLCKCKCGLEKVIRKDTLVLKLSSRCWNCRKKDYTGERFGKWTVIESDKEKKQHWICKCECGKLKSVMASNLINGCASCIDCWKLDHVDNLAGQQFGSWLVLKKGEKRKWLCRCKCGVEKLVYAQALKKKNSTSCSRCSSYARSAGSQNKFPSQVLVKIKQLAKKRGIFENLGANAHDFLYHLLNEKQNGYCALSGMPIMIAATNYGHTHGESTASLDRIDSKKGYTKDNVQWVHKWINFMKQDLSQDEFITFCEAVVKHKRG